MTWRKRTNPSKNCNKAGEFRPKFKTECHVLVVFTKQPLCARVFVVRNWFEVRWKALILAHRMVGQTSKSDRMRPISWVLKCRGWPEIEFEISKKVDKKTFYFVNSAFSNVMRSAPKSQTPTFDPPLDASGSELSSAGRIIAVRQTCEVVAPHFWKRDEMFEFWAK